MLPRQQTVNTNNIIEIWMCYHENIKLKLEYVTMVTSTWNCCMATNKSEIKWTMAFHKVFTQKALEISIRGDILT